MFKAWFQYRRFRRQPAQWRNIVFYAESRNDWHHFEPLVRDLTGRQGRPVSYLTSDAGDFAFALARSNPNLRVFDIGEGAVRTWAFQMLDTNLLVLTVMDLGNFQLKRSINPVHYVYVFHAPGSTHMVDHADSYDHYDTLFCVGPHHEREIRARERLLGLPAKNLVAHGYHRIEQLVRDAAGRPARARDARPTVLVAPTWGETSTLNLCGEALLQALLDAGLKVILRPHYMTAKRWPQLIQDLLRRFGGHPDFTYIDWMGESDSLFDSDLLVCDWSSMSIEYALALEKPVLFIDVPKRVRNPDWQALGIEPMEIAIRERVGRVLAPADIAQAGRQALELIRDGDGFKAGMAAVRQDYLYNFGRSVEVAAAEIARLADRRQPVRA